MQKLPQDPTKRRASNHGGVKQPGSDGCACERDVSTSTGYEAKITSRTKRQACHDDVKCKEEEQPWQVEVHTREVKQHSNHVLRHGNVEFGSTMHTREKQIEQLR